MTTGPAETMGQLYVRALESARRYVNGVSDDQWHDDTPCTDWDVRQLVNHITSENFWAAELFRGKTLAEVGTRFDGDLLGDDPKGTFSRAADLAKEAALGPGAMERTTHLSMGDVPGSEYARQLFQDMLIHGWDVAKATGQDTRLDPDLVQACLPIAEDLVRQFGSFGIYGTPQDVPPDADPQTRLLAILGRRA